MSVELQELEALADPAKAAEMAAYHKAPRRYLGVSVPQITERADGWRATRTVEERVALADALWQTDIHEARIAAAKLLRQARMRPDDGAWALICGWVPQFDAWAIADHACDAGQRRLLADPSRVETVESWTTSEHMWSRRAALVITLPILGLIADIAGLVGGALMSWIELGISPSMFRYRLISDTSVDHVIVGLSKAPVFAIIIGIIGCHAGMKVGKDAESLGAQTSTAVVNAIFAVIVADALFSIFFAEIGL